jgi:hypothetical protein
MLSSPFAGRFGGLRRGSRGDRKGASGGSLADCGDGFGLHSSIVRQRWVILCKRNCAFPAFSGLKIRPLRRALGGLWAGSGRAPGHSATQLPPTIAQDSGRNADFAVRICRRTNAMANLQSRQVTSPSIFELQAKLDAAPSSGQIDTRIKK